MDEHERRRLMAAVDGATAAAARRLQTDEARLARVTVVDVIEWAADDGLTVTHAAAAAALREWFELRGGEPGLTTDAFGNPPGSE